LKSLCFFTRIATGNNPNIWLTHGAGRACSFAVTVRKKA
jgi:hypothetical protein